MSGYLTTRGIVFKEATSLATKVVRYVFNSDRRRAHTYARAITIAYEAGIESIKFSKWVCELGGVEEVRRINNGVTPSEQAAADSEKALEILHKRECVVSFSAEKEFLPNNEGTHDFSIALIRRNSDGTSSLVYGCNNKTLVKQVLAYAGKELAKKKADKEEKDADRARKQEREEIVGSVAA